MLAKYLSSYFRHTEFAPAGTGKLRLTIDSLNEPKISKQIQYDIDFLLLKIKIHYTVYNNLLENWAPSSAGQIKQIKCWSAKVRQ